MPTPTTSTSTRHDFQWRGDLWKKVHEDEDAFWRGEIIKLPDDDWVEFRGKQHSYFAYLMEEPVLEEVFLYAVFRARQRSSKRLQKRYQLGDSSDHSANCRCSAALEGDHRSSETDRLRDSRASSWKTEIKALEDLSAGSEASFDGIVDRQATVEI